MCSQTRSWKLCSVFLFQSCYNGITYSTYLSKMPSFTHNQDWEIQAILNGILKCYRLWQPLSFMAMKQFSNCLEDQATWGREEVARRVSIGRHGTCHYQRLPCEKRILRHTQQSVVPTSTYYEPFWSWQKKLQDPALIDNTSV